MLPLLRVLSFVSSFAFIFKVRYQAHFAWQLSLLVARRGAQIIVQEVFPRLGLGRKATISAVLKKIYYEVKIVWNKITSSKNTLTKRSCWNIRLVTPKGAGLCYTDGNQHLK